MGELKSELIGVREDAVTVVVLGNCCAVGICWVWSLCSSADDACFLTSTRMGDRKGFERAEVDWSSLLLLAACIVGSDIVVLGGGEGSPH